MTLVVLTRGLRSESDRMSDYREITTTDLLGNIESLEAATCTIWSYNRIKKGDLNKVAKTIMQLRIKEKFSCFNPSLGKMILERGFLSPMQKYRLKTVEILFLKFLDDARILRHLKGLAYLTRLRIVSLDLIKKKKQKCNKSQLLSALCDLNPREDLKLCINLDLVSTETIVFFGRKPNVIFRLLPDFSERRPKYSSLFEHLYFVELNRTKELNPFLRNSSEYSNWYRKLLTI